MPQGAQQREWHAWSVWKTEALLGGYLPEFTQASKRAPHCVFIDCFAGTARNFDITSDQEFPSSPRVALRTTPPFSHVVLFELPDTATDLEASLTSEFPHRMIHVLPGDCNERIRDGLDWLRDQGSPRSGPQLGPTLAYLDPNALELEWSTVVKLATWTGQRSTAEFRRLHPVELLILFPTGPMRRNLPGPGKPEAREGLKGQLDLLFGNKDWRGIYNAQRSGLISGESSWIHYVDHYRLGLQRLGYRDTSAIEVRNTKNVVLYHMVFATGHPAGAKIMRAINRKARTVLPKMIDAERNARRDRGSRLFAETDVELDWYKANPTRWAQLFDYAPEPFNPSRLRPRQEERQQLELDL